MDRIIETIRYQFIKRRVKKNFRAQMARFEQTQKALGRVWEGSNE